MPTAVKIKKQYEYIPDSSHADVWITPDIFKTKRRNYYRVLPNGNIVREYVNKRRNKGGNHA